MKLTIELVPKTSWYSNVRSNVTRNEWDTIRKKCYALANHKCEICDKSTKLEAHEIWEYDDNTNQQILTGIIGLCNECHTVKHPGMANILGKASVVIDQLMKVNSMTHDEAIKYRNEAFKVLIEKSHCAIPNK